MELSGEARPAPRYGLEEAAAMLGVPPSNLLLWEVNFGEELRLARDWRGELVFTDIHLEAIRQIQRMVVEERRSLQEVRQALRKDAGGPEGRAEPTAPGKSEIQPAPERTSETLETLTQTVADLRADISYLVEENRALQELIGRLIVYLESQAKEKPPGPQAAYPSETLEPSRASQRDKSETMTPLSRLEPDRVLDGSPETPGKHVVRGWRPTVIPGGTPQ